ncbi:MAG: hypothetical protein LAO30_23435 [Acidobacteriia bacterium]|nr:hypothetical protein [Terriglobia bacterium]
MKTKICHHDTPTETSNDCGAEIRERAAEATGFHQGQHIAESRAEVERNGGPEGVLDAVVKRIERGAR